MNFLIRSLTSLIYVGLLLGSLYIDAVFFSIVLLLMAIIAQWELQKITNKKIILSYLLFPAGYMIAQFTPESLPYIMGLGVLGSLIMLSFFSSSNTPSYSLTAVYFLSLFQISIPLILLALLGESNPLYVLYFFGINSKLLYFLYFCIFVMFCIFCVFCILIFFGISASGIN